jgi:hypothetical protein
MTDGLFQRLAERFGQQGILSDEVLLLMRDLREILDPTPS